MNVGASRGATAIIGVVYGVLTLYQLVQQQWLDTAIWLVIGAGLALSVTSTPEQWRARPRLVRWTAMGATLLGLILFVIRIALDWRS